LCRGCLTSSWSARWRAQPALLVSLFTGGRERHGTANSYSPWAGPTFVFPGKKSVASLYFASQGAAKSAVLCWRIPRRLSIVPPLAMVAAAIDAPAWTCSHLVGSAMIVRSASARRLGFFTRWGKGSASGQSAHRIKGGRETSNASVALGYGIAQIEFPAICAAKTGTDPDA